MEMDAWHIIIPGRQRQASSLPPGPRDRTITAPPAGSRPLTGRRRLILLSHRRRTGEEGRIGRADPTNKMAAMAAFPVLYVCLALSHIPASAHATLLDPLANANNTSSLLPPVHAAAPSVPEAAAPSVHAAAASSFVHEATAPSAHAAAPSSSSTEKDENKKEREQKELEEIEKLKQEAKARGLVSFTNGTGSYKGMSREFVDGHNKVRARYGVPLTKWNNKLARHARRWSNAMRKDCQLKHSGSKYGESIFRSANDTGWTSVAKDALWKWAEEEPIYDKSTGRCLGGRPFSECGHFSLMVNAKNQKIGCGRGECYRGGVFMVCNYSSREP